MKIHQKTGLCSKDFTRKKVCDKGNQTVHYKLPNTCSTSKLQNRKGVPILVLD